MSRSTRLNSQDAALPTVSLTTTLVMALKAQLRKFGSDAANQLVTALCAAIFAGLLYYLGRDFFHNKLAGSDHEIKAWLYLVFYHLANAFLAKYLVGRLWPHSLGHNAVLTGSAALGRHEHTSETLAPLQQWLGESPAAIHKLALALKLADIVLVCGILGFLAMSPFLGYSVAMIFGVFLGYMALVAGLTFAFNRLHRFSDQRSPKPLPQNTPSFVKAVSAMAHWRLRQLYRNNFSVVFYAALALLALITGAILAMGGLDYRLVGFIFAMAGFFVAAPLYHQLAEDLSASWFERNNPVSHSHVICCYFYLALLHLLVWLSIAFACIASITAVAGSGSWAELWAEHQLHILIWLGLVAIAPVLCPGVLFQIDGTKPAIQLIIAFMATVVLCSLVLIEPLVWFLLPFASYIGCYYQQGRYYRA